MTKQQYIAAQKLMIEVSCSEISDEMFQEIEDADGLLAWALAKVQEPKA